VEESEDVGYKVNHASIFVKVPAKC
jgi:hypothetical protein